MLDFLPTKLYVFQALDKIDSHIDTVQYQVQKTSLPTILQLKLGILVELIANNLDMQDGLVNDADGVFQLHTTHDEDILWIQFDDPIVGIS